jgi:hypothetical protein
MEVLKVSGKSSPNSVAGAMAGVIRQSGSVEVHVVGAGALVLIWFAYLPSPTLRLMANGVLQSD